MDLVIAQKPFPAVGPVHSKTESFLWISFLMSLSPSRDIIMSLSSTYIGIDECGAISRMKVISLGVVWNIDK